MRKLLLLFSLSLLCLPTFADNDLFKSLLLNQLNRKLAPRKQRRTTTKTEVIYVIPPQNQPIGQEPTYSSNDAADKQIKELKHYLFKNPSDAKAYLKLGKIYGAIKNYEKAEEALLDSLRYDPSSVESHYYLGMVYLRMGNNFFAEKKAVEQYKELLLLDQDVAEKFKAMLPKGAMDSEKVRQAKEIANSDKENIDLQVGVARQYILESKWEEAYKKLKLLLKTYPESEIVLTELAKCELHRNDNWQAIKCFLLIASFHPEKVSLPLETKKDPNNKDQKKEEIKENVRAYLTMSYAHSQVSYLAHSMNRNQDALIERENSQGFFNEAVKNLFLLAESYHKDGENGKALEVLVNSSQWLKPYPEFFFLSGKIALDLGLQEKAREYFEKALTMDQDINGISFFYAIALGKCGQTQAAIETFIKAIAEKDYSYPIKDESARVLFAIACNKNHLEEKSIKMLEEISPKSSSTKAFLGEAFLLTGDKLNADVWFKEAIDGCSSDRIEFMDQLSPASLITLGKIAYKVDKFTLAQGFFELVVKKEFRVWF